MTFSYIDDTPITIDGKPHTIRMENGMTGISSRMYWLDGKIKTRAVTQSGDISKGNHFIYRIKWRDTPWDKVDIIIHEDELPTLLSEENKWREPAKLSY